MAPEFQTPRAGSTDQETRGGPVRIAFVLPHFDVGGVEMVVAAYLAHLDRARFTPTLFLRSARGRLLARVPPDVEVVDAGGRRAALLAPFLARAFAARRIAVAYAGTNAVNLAAIAAARLLPPARRPRLLVGEHTSAGAYLAEAKLAPLRRAALRALYPLADRVVAPLPEIADDWARTLGRPGLRTAVCRNPVLDDARLDALAAAPADRRPGLVAAAGRLVPAKGHDVLLRAFARLAADRPATRLAIYGEGPERARLAALTAEFGLAGRVTLAGHVDDLPAALAHAEVFALASRREGFGNVVVEALAAGTPVVATRCAGPSRILADGRFGRLVPPDDPAALADALAALLDDPAVRARLAADGRIRARDFTTLAAVRDFELLLEAILDGPPRARGPPPLDQSDRAG